MKIAVIEKRFTQLRAQFVVAQVTNSGRSDGRCGKVAEAIEAELDGPTVGVTYDCWTVKFVGFIAGTNCLTARLLTPLQTNLKSGGWGDLTVLPPDSEFYSYYRAAPPAHLLFL
ncbi:MAG: hypothetical protein R2911_28070 [Caldilineaceae bacterium]